MSSSKNPLQLIHATIALDLTRFDASSNDEQELFRIPATAGLLLRSPLAPSMISLNARGLIVQRVLVNGVECKFRLRDFFACLVTEDISKDLHTLSAMFTGDAEASELEEFEIDLTDPQCFKKEGPSSYVYNLLIEYEVRPPTVGSTVIVGADHVYSRTGFVSGGKLGSGCGARCWFPCVDDLKTRCVVRVELETKLDHWAAASGTKVDTRVSETEDSLIHTFETERPIAPFSAAFVAGRMTSEGFSSSAKKGGAMYMAKAAVRKTAFDEDLLEQIVLKPATEEKLSSAIVGMLNYLGLPEEYFKGVATVFVPDYNCVEIASAYAQLCVVSSQALYDVTDADTTLATICKCVFPRLVVLASQIFGVRITPSSPSDAWVICGLAGFVALQGIRKAYGETTYLGLLAHWSARVVDAHELRRSVLHGDDVVSVPQAGYCMAKPLVGPRPYSTAVDAALWSASSVSLDSVFANKATIVMRMLDLRAGDDAFQQVLKRIAKSSEVTHLSEIALLTAVKSFNPQSYAINSWFVKQWLRHATLPKFRGTVSLSKAKKVYVELTQVNPVHGRIFQGSITIRFVDYAGRAHDEEKQISNIGHRWTLDPAASSAASSAASNKRLMKLRALEESVAPSTVDPSESGTDLATLLNRAAESKTKWWTNTTNIRYVVLDPARAWLCADVEWIQPQAYWFEALFHAHGASASKSVKYVDLQLLALRQLAKSSSASNQSTNEDEPLDESEQAKAAVRALNKTLAAAVIAGMIAAPTRAQIVRVEACKALGVWHRLHPGDGTALTLLVMVHSRLYENKATNTVVPLDYKAQNESTVRGQVIETLSELTNANGVLPDEAFDVVSAAINGYDVAHTVEDDGPYLGSLLRAAKNLVLSNHKKHQDSTELLKWIVSVMEFDDFSSEREGKRKTVASAAIDALGKLPLTDDVKFRVMRLHDSEDHVVREAVFRFVLYYDVVQRRAKGCEWFLRMDWLIHVASTDRRPLTRLSMAKMLTRAHAETIGEVQAELGLGEKSSAGCYWPMLETIEYFESDPRIEEAALRAAKRLWFVMNQATAFDSSLRMLFHQLWLCIWGLQAVPLLDKHDVMNRIPNLGMLEKWDEVAEKEFVREDASMVRLENVESLRLKHEENMLRKEQAARHAAPPASNAFLEDEDGSLPNPNSGGNAPTSNAMEVVGEGEDVIQEEDPASAAQEQSLVIAEEDEIVEEVDDEL